MDIHFFLSKIETRIYLIHGKQEERQLMKYPEGLNDFPFAVVSIFLIKEEGLFLYFEFSP